MAGKADTFLKIAVGASVLFSAVAIGNYYLFYLPNRDAQAVAQKAREQSNIQYRYNQCLIDASLNYSANWDQSCKVHSDDSKRGRSACKGDKVACEAAWPAIQEKDCSLPTPQANARNEAHQRSKELCLNQMKAGFQ